MNIIRDIREGLHRDPFEPFRVVTSSGDSYAVRNPHLVAMMDHRLFIALPKGRWTFVPYLHISSIESLAAGNGGRATRRKRRTWVS